MASVTFLGNSDTTFNTIVKSGQWNPIFSDTPSLTIPSTSAYTDIGAYKAYSLDNFLVIQLEWGVAPLPTDYNIKLGRGTTAYPVDLVDITKVSGRTTKTALQPYIKNIQMHEAGTAFVLIVQIQQGSGLVPASERFLLQSNIGLTASHVSLYADVYVWNFVNYQFSEYKYVDPCAPKSHDISEPFDVAANKAKYPEWLFWGQTNIKFNYLETNPHMKNKTFKDFP